MCLIDEMDRHLARLSQKKSLNISEMNETAKILYEYIQFIDRSLYQESYEMYAPIMASVDPKDTDFIALAHTFSSPLWTNDKKLLSVLGVSVFDTQSMLRMYR
jgi:predicted nucleic acid-binding protein